MAVSQNIAEFSVVYRGDETLQRVSLRLLAAVLALGLLMPGCGQPPPPPPPPPAAAAAPPRPIALDPIRAIVVKPASSGTAEFEMHRAGHAGEATVSVTPPQDGITVQADPIPGDSATGRVVVTVGEQLGDTELVVPIPIVVTLDGMTAQETLSVTVPTIELPSFQQDGELIVQPGRTGQATLRIDRKGYDGKPFQLFGLGKAGVDGAAPPPEAAAVTVPGADGLSSGTAPLLTPGMSCSVEPVGDHDDIAKVTVSVASDVADGQHTAGLRGTFLGRSIAPTVAVTVLARPYRIATLQAVTLAPGESRSVEFPVTRTAYAGPIDMVAEGLPEGVSMEAVAVEAGGETVTATFSADAAAPSAVRSASMKTTGGPFASTEPIVVRVRRSDDPPLPAALMASPEVMRMMRPGSIGGRLTTDSKRALSDRYGGTAECEEAIMRGLAWLARNQQPDGCWTLRGSAAAGTDPAAGDQQPEPEPESNPIAATAFAILPFLGEGITHLKAPAVPVELATYQPIVEKGLVYLGSHQLRAKTRDDGFFGGGIPGHCLATMAFCEAYGLSRDDRVKVNARQGIKYLAASQDDAGGWGVAPGLPSDLMTTGWVVMALRSGQLVGLTAPAKTLTKARSFVDSCAAGPADAAASRYRPINGQPLSVAATAAGLLARMSLGWQQDEPDLQAGATFLMNSIPPEDADALGSLSQYFFTTQVLHHLSGDDFDLWNHHVREHLLRFQQTSGDVAGSWNPQGTDFGAQGGRMYATVVSLLTLQNYYRHLPMYLEAKRSPAGTAATAEKEPTPAGE